MPLCSINDIFLELVFVPFIENWGKNRKILLQALGLASFTIKK